MRRPTEDQLADLFDEIRTKLDDLEHGLMDRSPVDRRRWKRWSLRAVDLLRLASVRTRDGYRTNSMGGSGGPSSVLDENGDPMPPVPDSTGNAVVESLDKNLEPWMKLIGGLRTARNALASAETALAKASPRPPETPKTVCRACGEWLTDSDRVKYSDRCRWCHDWWTRFGDDPPGPILEARRADRRITSKVIREVLDTETAKRIVARL